MTVLRRFGPSIKMLFAHKVRFTLTIASVAVGVAAVVVTGAIGTGAQQEVLRKTASMGTNLLVVRPAQVKNSAARKQVRGVVTSLKLDDYEAIAEVPGVREAAPGIESMLMLKARGNSMSARVLGTTSAYIDVCNFRLLRGRFLDEDDNANARRVAVLGARVAENVFENQNAIGDEIRIRDVPFEVIGILEAKGVLPDGSEEDSQIVIPIRTALRRVFNSNWLNPIFVGVRDSETMDQTETEIGMLLRERHRLELRGRRDDFSIQNKTKMLAVQKQVVESFNMLATGMAAVSLVVGGAGILALMLMSVKERTAEIGLRMAVGARPQDIFAQFLLEAVILALGGWMTGAALGTFGATLISLTTKWQASISSKIVLGTLSVAVTTGLGFGAYPARRAALVPPIQALSVE